MMAEHELLELISALVCLLRDGVVTFINHAGMRMLELDAPEDVVGIPFETFVTADYRFLMEAGWELLADEDFVPLKLSTTHGLVFDAEMRVRRLGPEPGQFLLEVRDISKFVKSAAALREREERLTGVLRSVAEGVVTIGEDGLIESGNPSAERMFGCTSGQLVRQAFATLLAEVDEDGEAHPADLSPAALSGRTRESVGRRRDGSLFPVEISVSELRQGRQRLFTAIMRDISERKENEARVRRLAHHDSLTGLPNRNLLNDRMTHAMARVRRHGGRMAVLYVDLDRFKPINDSLGHEAGDRVLQVVAQRLMAAVRSSDTVARVGGDEFVVVTEEIVVPEDAGVVARKIIDALSPPIPVGETLCTVGASVGIAIYPDDGFTMDDVCRAADVAMYRVKHSGRNAYTYFGAGSEAEPFTG